MEPTTENPADIWAKFRTGQKSIEELAKEQGYRPPESGWSSFQGFMDDKEWEAFQQALARWREEDRDRTNR